MELLRHSQLPPLPGLLDNIRCDTLPPRCADLLPPAGASLRDPRRGGHHHDLLVFRLHCDRRAAAVAGVLYLEWMPGFAGCDCIWGFLVVSDIIFEGVQLYFVKCVANVVYAVGFYSL